MKAYIRVTAEGTKKPILHSHLGFQSTSKRKGSKESYVFTYEKYLDARIDMLQAWEKLRQLEKSYTRTILLKNGEFLTFDLERAVLVEV